MTEARVAELEAIVGPLVEDKAKRDIIAKESPRERKARLTKEEQVAEIMENLERLGGKNVSDDDIIYRGTQLILPEDMSLRQLHEWSGLKLEDEEQETSFSRTFNYRPWDGAWCMWNYFKHQFGAVLHKGSVRYNMFGATLGAPELISDRKSVV